MYMSRMKNIDINVEKIILTRARFEDNNYLGFIFVIIISKRNYNLFDIDFYYPV